MIHGGLVTYEAGGSRAKVAAPLVVRLARH